MLNCPLHLNHSCNGHFSGSVINKIKPAQVCRSLPDVSERALFARDNHERTWHDSAARRSAKKVLRTIVVSEMIASLDLNHGMNNRDVP